MTRLTRSLLAADRQPASLSRPDIVDRYKSIFAEETVNKYQSDPSKVVQENDYPARHYAQSDHPPNEDDVTELLSRVDVPTSGLNVLIYAGYTGELAAVLSELGHEIIFTDPIAEWVDNATENGFEAYQETLQSCPGEFFQWADAVMTFEGYIPFDENKYTAYEGLRALTTPYGLLFFESEFTRTEMQSGGAKLSVKSTLKPFEKVYGALLRYRERDGLRVYHLQAVDETMRKIVFQDATVIVCIQVLMETDADLFGEVRSNPAVNDAVIDAIQKSPALKDVSESEIHESLRRIKTLLWEGVTPSMRKYLISELVQVGPKQFAVPEQFELLEL